MLIINEEFVMGVMKTFKDELPHFEDFYEHHYGKKNQNRVVRNAKKFIPNKELLDEILHPKNPTNIEDDLLMEGHGETLADA